VATLLYSGGDSFSDHSETDAVFALAGVVQQIKRGAVSLPPRAASTSNAEQPALGNS
jgi:hypothetical protein